MTPLLPAFVGAPERNRVYHCDALTLLRALPDASVDAIVTDPPYGIGYSTGHVRWSTSKFGTDTLDTSWLKDAYRIAKPDSVLYLCTRWDVAQTWRDAIDAAGYKTKQCIVWDKGNWSAGDLDYYASQTEFVLFAIKGRPALYCDSRPSNIWRIARETRAETRLVVNPAVNLFDHPTQKPVELMERMILDSTRPGNLIVDPFAGSGTTLLAAANQGRHYVGCDISLDYCDVARARLAQPYTLPMFAEAGA